MKWPNHTDYQDALQDPASCFDAPDLKAAQPACDALGLPRVMSGNFASVYEVAAADRRYAVRCFVRQVSGTQARYARLSEHLENVKLPWLVGFDFIFKGVLVQGDWYPIVKMDWVQGVPLNNYIEQILDQPEKLRDLASQFRALVNDLRRHKIAHGDFQHGNIMVTPAGELRLVDYDGMYCPAFGKHRSPELGHANFQHPLRLADYYDESLDNFSSLVIYTSLLALAEEPSLWKEFHTGDNLILTSADYRNVKASKAFARLRASRSDQVRQLSALIEHCASNPIALTPWFEETLVALNDGTLRAQIASLEATADTAPPGDPRGDGWWENSQVQTAIGTRKAPMGSRPAEAAAAMASGSRPAPEPVGSRPAPAVGGSRPAPVASGSRPAPALGPTGTRPAPQPEPAPAVTYPPMSEREEGGMSLMVKLVIVGAILLAVMIFASWMRRSNATPPPQIEQAE